MTRAQTQYGGVSDQNWSLFAKEDKDRVWAWTIEKILDETQKMKEEHPHIWTEAFGKDK